MTKKSSYQIRIEKKLADLSIGLDPRSLVRLADINEGLIESLEKTITGNQHFKPVKVYRHTGRKCDLCGHNPIKNVFVIENKARHQELHIGSDCARNYIDADLVSAICKQYNLEYKKIVNPIKFEADIEILEWALSGKAPAVRSLHYLRYNLVHQGSPRNLLTKIRTGKNIGKREKEVLAFWKHVYDNQDAILVVEEIIKLTRGTVIAIRQEEHKYKENLRKTWAFFRDFPKQIAYDIGVALQDVHRFGAAQGRQAVYDKALLNANRYELSGFLSDIKHRYLSGYDLTVRQLAYLEGIANRSEKPAPVDCSEVPELLEKAHGLSLNSFQSKFVNSISRQFERKNTLSIKQVNYLKKIAA
jgi:hypothetical protein